MNANFLKCILILSPCILFVELSQAFSQTQPTSSEAGFEARFKETRAMLARYCIRCHDEKQRESGIRVDQLDSSLSDASLGLWEAIGKQVASGAMPPKEELQPTADEKGQLLSWIEAALHVARSRDVARNGAMRRLTVAQYRNTLRELLGIEENLATILPPDASSKDGFTNNAQLMLLSPLQIEAYFQIAEQALGLAIVSEDQPPTIQAFQMELGRGINGEPCADKLILGANNLLLANEDFTVSEAAPNKEFAFRPFAMQRKFRFIEGYQGNDTVRGWRDFEGIYHAVFACMRGSEGYPKGLAYETAPEGLMLRPAIPSPEIFGQSTTYGPHANFKVSLRELPDVGRFRVTVSAAKVDDGLLLDARLPAVAEGDNTIASFDSALDQEQTLHLPDDGLYQVDIVFPASNPQSTKKQKDVLSLKLGSRSFSGQVTQVPFLAVRLPAGELKIAASMNDKQEIQRITVRRVDSAHALSDAFRKFESRIPELGVYLGLRRDCGSTLNRVGEPSRVTSTEFKEFVFDGALSNFPSPDVEKDNVNYLAGIREIGVRSEYTDDRDMPRLVIRKVSFEGPYHDTWPPKSHSRIFIDRQEGMQDDEYAESVITRFAERAYRRPLQAVEQQELMQLWREAMRERNDLQASIRETLVTVLTSPQFLFLIEKSAGPHAEDLDEWELASKLSYFLWNQPPDERLLTLARSGQLRSNIDAEVDRLIDDGRFDQFTSQFVSQWLGLEKIEIVETDEKRFPKLTRDTKVELQREPIEFFKQLVRRNEPIEYLVRSPYIVANGVVATYYGCGELCENGLTFAPLSLPADRRDLGGVLTQAAILAGLSDGRESNPVKRGAWFARRMIATPPDDPPPNVPKLEDLTQLTLRQRLERHRNVKGCSNCHRGIDPWGMPFEAFNAAGVWKQDSFDASSQLPDDTSIADFEGFRQYLASKKMLDQIAFSTIKHLSIYAIGRSLSYNENLKLRQQVLQIGGDAMRMRDLIHAVVRSEVFMKK